jgi:hypothetical protein
MKWMLPIAGAVALAGCQTAADRAGRQDRLEAEIAARQGAEVDRICFARSVNGWRPLGRDALLLRHSGDRWYKVDLAGTCDPEWAFNAIGIETRPAGSSCLSRGDHISTPDTPTDGRCVIIAIHEWDEDAEIPDAPEE